MCRRILRIPLPSRFKGTPATSEEQACTLRGRDAGGMRRGLSGADERAALRADLTSSSGSGKKRSSAAFLVSESLDVCARRTTKGEADGRERRAQRQGLRAG